MDAALSFVRRLSDKGECCTHREKQTPTPPSSHIHTPTPTPTSTSTINDDDDDNINSNNNNNSNFQGARFVPVATVDSRQCAFHEGGGA